MNQNHELLYTSELLGRNADRMTFM